MQEDLFNSSPHKTSICSHIHSLVSHCSSVYKDGREMQCDECLYSRDGGKGFHLVFTSCLWLSPCSSKIELLVGIFPRRIQRGKFLHQWCYLALVPYIVPTILFFSIGALYPLFLYFFMFSLLHVLIP